MNLTAAREPLLRACQLVAAAAARNSTKPVLANVKATAADDRLTLVATDTEVGVRYEVRGVKVDRPGVAVLHLAKLTHILRECDAAGVWLQAGDDGAKVELGTSRFELPGFPAAEFPDLPAFDPAAYHEAPAGVLRRLVRRTTFATGNDGQRFALSGVLWEAEGKAARLVATDSKRLAVCEGPAALYGDAPPDKRAHVIPKKAVTLLDRVLTDDGELVRVALAPNEALFQTERATVYTRLIEGRYPPYRDIIGQTRKAAAVKLTLPAGAFLAHLRRAAIMSDDESKRVDLTFEAGRVVMQARGAETGSAEVELPLPEYDGPRVEVAVDPQYVCEFFRAIDEQTVSLEMLDGTKPMLFKAGEQTTYCVMPLAG